MKARSTQPAASRGAALILALVFIAGIAILTMSALSLSRNDVRTAAVDADRSRIEIAMAAGFEDAKSVLLSATAGPGGIGVFGGDDYVVTAVTESGKSTQDSARYSYIVRASEEKVTATPLFAGGAIEEVTLPSLGDLFSVDVRPKVKWRQGSQPETLVELPPLTDLDANGRLIKQPNRPKTAWTEVDPMNPREEMVYTYWIEDLAGYPNLDVVGHFPLAGPQPAQDGMALRWGGYPHGDKRVQDTPYPVIDSDASSRITHEFLEAVTKGPDGRPFQYAQRVSGQASPGLSPREMHIYPWTDSGKFGLQEHPWWRIPWLRANGGMFPSNRSMVMAAPLIGLSGDEDRFAQNLENRFVRGLPAYIDCPIVPFGFGYADAGRPRLSLNRAVRRALTDSEGAVNEIAGMITRNLDNPQTLRTFAFRKGGFPEDYVKTLAASIIDYADEDSSPTLHANAAAIETDRFRGIDSCPVMNEVFFKLTYDGYDYGAGDTFVVDFTGMPFIEFWNPTNQRIAMENLTLNVTIPDQQKLVIKTPDGLKSYFSDADNITSNGPLIMPVFLQLEPNEYKVVQFADIKWQFKIPRQGQALLSLGRVNDEKFGIVAGNDGADSRLHFELLQNDRIIDQTGRRVDLDSTSEDTFGWHLRRFGQRDDPDDLYQVVVDDFLQSGEYMIRSAAAGLVVNHFGEGLGFGDSRMGYYHTWSLKVQYYTRDSSPGFRNTLFSKMRSGQFTHEARFRDWPDGGYDSNARALDLGKRKPITPMEAYNLNQAAIVESRDQSVALAPWRISNLGRFYSVAELGHIHDPVMWRPDESTIPSQVSKSRRALVESLPMTAMPSQRWGGGNSLRIGRPEHSKFDSVGFRASQLLDLFHVGVPGTNCQFGSYSGGEFVVVGGPDAYDDFDPRIHQLPPTAVDAMQSRLAPFAKIYPPELHLYAESPFRWVQGHLNINSAATVFEVEALLRGLFASSNVTWSGPPSKPVFSQRTVDSAVLSNVLNMDPAAKDRDGRTKKTIGEVARRIYTNRPFLSPSHLAHGVSLALGAEGSSRGSALPDFASDAVAEEPFARVFNSTTLSSRCFRIYVKAELRTKRRLTSGGAVLSEGGVVLARGNRIFEVYVEPIRELDPTEPNFGKIVSSRFQILSQTPQ